MDGRPHFGHDLVDDACYEQESSSGRAHELHRGAGFGGSSDAVAWIVGDELIFALIGDVRW